METSKYVRKQFGVEAVQVTADNMPAIAEWTHGELRTTEPSPTERQYVAIKVLNPMNERQSRAFLGDWVLYDSNGFKIYTNKAFERNFEKEPKVMASFQEVKPDDIHTPDVPGEGVRIGG